MTNQINTYYPLPFLTSTENNLFIFTRQKIKAIENEISELIDEAGNDIFLIDEYDEDYEISFAYSIKKLENEIISLKDKVFDYVTLNDIRRYEQKSN